MSSQIKINMVHEKAALVHRGSNCQCPHTKPSFLEAELRVIGLSTAASPSCRIHDGMKSR